MQNNLNLAIGKPDIGKPAVRNEEGNVVENEIYASMATYTRFAIPFAFQLQNIPKQTEAVTFCYELNDKDDLSYVKRRKYFTRETADTLYERGQWLSICDNWKKTLWGTAEVTVTLRGKNFKIGMLAPQIILFEVPEIKHQKQRNILQTGFLYVDIYFPDNQDTPPQLDDLLVLNEFFRYFGIPYDNHATIFQNIFSNIPVNSDTISLDGSETIGSLKNPLKCYFERWATMLEIPIKYGDQYFRLFPKDWGKDARSWMYNKEGSNQPEHWQIYADNRCYVWTVALLEKGGESLRINFESDSSNLVAKDYGHWIKLLNVDSPPYEEGHYVAPEQTHASITEFEKHWVDERTYKRWEEGGTWYGFSYHSAAILSPHDPDNPDPKKIVRSFAFLPSVSYYFDTTILLFYIRMSLFRFGRELSKIIVIQDDDSKRRKELGDLRNKFSMFTVLYRFPAPSNQQQSIEMYEINRKFFDLDNFFEEVQQEIDNTHEFLETVEANELASSANKLANWGIPLAAGGLTTALFSMSDLDLSLCSFGGAECSLDSDQLIQIAIVAIVALTTAVGMKIVDKWKKNK